eukprot:917215-Prymnesium_polylepis.3
MCQNDKLRVRARGACHSDTSPTRGGARWRLGELRRETGAQGVEWLVPGASTVLALRNVRACARCL